MILHSLHSALRTLPLALCALATLSFVPLPPHLAPPSAQEAQAEGKLMQFTSRGHVLGFQQSGVIVASRDHALRAAFVGGSTVAPQAASSTGLTSQTASSTQAMAQPLQSVTYIDEWPGVTIRYDAGEGLTKSTYIVDTARGSADSIHLQYNRPVEIQKDGTLAIRFDTGVMAESAPIAWQTINGTRVSIEVHYTKLGPQDIGFTLGAYTPGIPVTIDPTLTWNTFLGGGGSDFGYGLAVDGSGNIYIAGQSSATWGSPVRAYSSGNDAFAAKLNSSGSLTWNTFLGGSGSDQGLAIAVDGSGNVYVAGYSNATWGSPVRAYSSGQDAFASKLSSSGSLTWNTFLGGSGSDANQGIAVDSSGNVYVAGYSSATWGSPVNAYSSGTNGFAAKLNASGTLTWNTFLGGSIYDQVNAIAVDGSGNVYVAGYSFGSWGSPVGAYTSGTDAFAVKLDSSGNLTWNTFLGGSGNDISQAIAVDGSGNVYVAGYSSATWGSPVRAYSSGNDVFAAKLDSSGSLTWNTFLGDSGDDEGYAIAVDGSGNVYVGGYSNATWGSPVNAYSSGYDAFAAKLNSSGSLTWNTFLGGSGTDYGYGIAVDGSGNVYVAGYSFGSWGSPVRAYSSGNDAFAAKLNDAAGGGSSTPPPRPIRLFEGVTIRIIGTAVIIYQE